MAGYGEFAEVYDLLTENVPYDEIAAYYSGIIERLGNGGKYLLDMGCGTGSLTLRLAAMGYDIVASDASAEMLTVAASKLCNDKVTFICQSMTETELYGAVDVAVSTLDSINHLDSAADIGLCFRKTAQNTVSGGLFLFDVNTVYKHRKILANNTFIYDVDGVYCAWQNEYDPTDDSVAIELDLFYENEDGSYDRGGERFKELALTEGEITELLQRAGFEVIEVYDYLTLDPPTDRSEKLMFVARKL